MTNVFLFFFLSFLLANSVLGLQTQTMPELQCLKKKQQENYLYF